MMTNALFQSTDVTIYAKGDVHPVRAEPSLLAAGWRGGQGLKWVASTTGQPTVGISDGVFGGFVLWGSDEDSDRFTSYTKKDLGTGFLLLCLGGWIIATRTFERYTYASRQVPPLVPLTYAPGDAIFLSLRGLFTKEDEWALSGDPRAPNPHCVGYVSTQPYQDSLGVPVLPLILSM